MFPQVSKWSAGKIAIICPHSLIYLTRDSGSTPKKILTFKGTVMQTEKALIKDRLRFSKVP